MSAAPTRSNAARQRGVSLIEVMIAILLLAVGMLGMLGMKLGALKYTGQANARATAAIHATDILDRLRANPVRAMAGDYDLALADPAPINPVTVAQTDLAQWRLHILDNLPGGTGSVAVQPDGNVRVVLRWNERSVAGDAASVLSFSFDARL